MSSREANPTQPSSGPYALVERPLHLGLNATVLVQPTFTGGLEWYGSYGARVAADGDEGRLVSMHTFTAAWDTWEMHPRGSEVVLATAGRIRLHQQLVDGALVTVDLGPGEYAVNAPGVWHTADVLEGPATAVFITAGAGTELKPR